MTSPPTVRREHELLQPTYRLWAGAAAAMDQDVKYTKHRVQNQFQSRILRNKFKMLLLSYRLCFHVNNIFGEKCFPWNYPWIFGLIFQRWWAVTGTNYFSSSLYNLASLWSAAVLRVLSVSPEISLRNRCTHSLGTFPLTQPPNCSSWDGMSTLLSSLFII